MNKQTFLENFLLDIDVCDYQILRI